MTWKPISDAPENVWLMVTWEGGLPYEPQGGPWDYGEYQRKAKTPPPPMMVAIYRSDDRGGIWRAYSEDGGIYGGIPDPTHWDYLQKGVDQ